MDQPGQINWSKPSTFFLFQNTWGREREAGAPWICLLQNICLLMQSFQLHITNPDNSENVPTIYWNKLMRGRNTSWTESFWCELHLCGFYKWSANRQMSVTCIRKAIVTRLYQCKSIRVYGSGLKIPLLQWRVNLHLQHTWGKYGSGRSMRRME